MMAVFWPGLTGLAVGSFLCLAADRYHPTLSNREWLRLLMFPSSLCPGCHQRLKLRDLLPLYSWCRLRGRCRYCQIKIPCRLVAAETLTALLFILLAHHQPCSATLIFSLILSAALILLSIIDWQHLMLPDAVTLPLIWLGLLYHLLLTEGQLRAAVIGAVVGWLFLWLLYWGFLALCRDEGVGYGDMKLLAALGAWCGWQALPTIAIIAALMGLLFFLCRRQLKGSVGFERRQPFGPCLSVAGWAVFFWQTQGSNVIPLL